MTVRFSIVPSHTKPHIFRDANLGVWICYRAGFYKITGNGQTPKDAYDDWRSKYVTDYAKRYVK